MFEKNKKADVLVVGAGPVGMLTALRLAKRGASVRIVDRGTRLNQQSFALALHPSTLALLEQDGLTPRFVEKGCPVRRLVFYEDGTPEFGIDLTGLPGPYPFALVLPQNVLERILAEELVKHDVSIEWNSELTAIEITKEGVKARIARLKETPQGYAVSDFARVEHSHSFIEAQAMAAADGFRSTTRHLLDIHMKRHAAPRHYHVFEFETDGHLEDELRVGIRIDKLTNILWPMGGGRCRWSFEIPAAKLQHKEPSREELERYLRTRVPWFTLKPTEVRWTTQVSFEQSRANAFAKGPVALVGDAAHQTLPAGVQSMNIGLAEAARLAEALTPDSGADIEAGLRRYSDECTAQWEELLDDSTRPRDDSFMGRCWQTIRSAVPASGNDLKELLSAVRR